MFPPGYKRIRLKFSSPLLYHNHGNEMRFVNAIKYLPVILEQSDGK